MANADLASTISKTVAILEATLEDYNIVKNDKGLHETFHEAGRGLLLVKSSLQVVEAQLDGHSLFDDPQGIMSSIEACNAKARLSQSIFRDVSQTPVASRFECYRTAVRREYNGSTVEDLLKGMMNDTCFLAKNWSVEIAMKKQVESLHAAMNKLSTMKSSLHNEESRNYFSNYGTGNQFNARGGIQNNNTGSGNQFPGVSFSGPVYFGNNPS